MTTPRSYATAVALLAVCLAACEAPPPRDASLPLTVFLVRHAEKTAASDDPGLTAAGAERAATLAQTLRDAGIERIHSSDYARTRDTAAPLADALGLPVELYDPRDLPALAARLREAGGRHLVVGHSNTTPVLAELLGGSPGTEIDEAREYDRLYLVTIAKDGTTNGALLRYGEVYRP